MAEKKFVMTKGKAKELHKIVRQVPVKKASTTRPARKVPLDYANKKKSTSPGPHGAKVTIMKTITTTPITKEQFRGSVKLKRFSHIGLGRTKEGRTPKSPGVPFERGSIGLRKKAREKTRTSKSQVGSATGEKRELKRQNKKRQSNRGSSRR
jgi:hypothetical protein